MRGVIQIRAMLAAALAGLLLAGTPAARAADLPQASVSAQDIAAQAIAAATAPIAPEPAPAPEQPAAAPAPAPAPAAAQTPVESEPAAAAEAAAPPQPAAPSEPAAAPKAAAPSPAPPANVNVSVRIGSAGDDGPVSQASDGPNVNVSVRVDSPGVAGLVEQAIGSASRPATSSAPTAQAQAPAAPAAQAQDDAAPVFVWHWTWTSACGLAAPGASSRAAVELDWQWSCDAAAAAPAVPVVPVLPALPALPAGVVPAVMSLPELPTGLPGDVVPVAAFPSFGTGGPGTPTALGLADVPQQGVALSAPAASLRAPGAGPLLPVGTAATTATLLMSRPASSTGGPIAPSHARRDRHARPPDPAPISPEIPLPPIALVTTSPAGSSAAGVVFLLALALLGAAALSGPSGPRLRLRAATTRLRARAGRRLERPG
jgi:hypothetical protein